MFTLKKLIIAAAMLAVSQATHPMGNPWKYFTAAYWLPYTCGDAFNKKPETVQRPKIRAYPKIK